MNRNIRLVAAGIAVGLVGVGLTGCVSDAHQASNNLSTEAEQFHIARDIVFYNAITDKYIAEVKGYCSVDGQDGLPGGTIAVTCRNAGGYSKDYLGKSDNVTWFMLQTSPAEVSAQHREIILKPMTVIPEFTTSTAG